MKDIITIAEVEDRIFEYIQVLNKRATCSIVDDYQVEYGRKLARIFGYNKGERSHVHVFINLDNGDVIKAATIKAPQKNSDGSYAVRFNLIDDDSRELLFSKAEFSGGYLYKRI